MVKKLRTKGVQLRGLCELSSNNRRTQRDWNKHNYTYIHMNAASEHSVKTHSSKTHTGDITEGAIKIAVTFGSSLVMLSLLPRWFKPSSLQLSIKTDSL